MNPVNKIIISRLNHAAGTATQVFQIPETVAEHNVMVEVLKTIRREYPGAWYCAKEWERKEYPTKIGNEPTSQLPVVLKADGKAKTVSSSFLKEDPPLEDVPL